MAKQIQIVIVVLDYPTIVVTNNKIKLLHYFMKMLQDY